MTSAPPKPEPGEKVFRNFRWFICALLFVGTTINYMDRQILALLKPQLDHDLGWTDQQYGAVNSVFQFTYAFSYVVFGWLIDRYGVKLGYAISMVGWSLASAGHALAGSVRGFMAGRFALGASEGGNFPACIKAVTLWFPPGERAFAASLFNSGANIGPVLAPLIVPALAGAYGWQAPFLVVGAAGLIWLIFWLWLYDAPEQSPRVAPAELAHIGSGSNAQSDAPGRVRWLGLFTHRQTWAIIWAKLLTDPINWFFLIWLPDLFKSTRHLDLKGSKQYLMAIYALAVVGSIFGGWFSGRLIKAGWSVTRARKTTLLICAMCAVPIAFSLSFENNWVLVGIIGLYLAAHQAWSATLYAVTSDLFPKRAVAAMSGIGGMAGSASGIVFPIFVGWLLDRYNVTAGGKTAGYTLIMGICSGAYLVAFAVNHLLAPRFEQTDLESPTSP